MFYSVRQTNARFKLNLSSRTLECHISLTWYYAENRNFPIAAILIHKKVACVKKKNAVYYLTNRFHVAVHLSSNRSQRTSKCGKDKKVAHEVITECVTDVLTTF